MLPDFQCAANGHDCGKVAGMSKQKNQKLNILYERLSVEDDRDTESQSIENQREILQEYAELHGFTPYVHAADDGYSGTTWERPAWKEIIAKVKAGEVAAIIVKDSSRIDRDFLRVGLFRELFMERNVRLICITDNYDSANGEDIFGPFRDIISEWYARDISNKIKAVFQSKGRKGIPISSKAPYGYRKDPLDKNRWIVDEPAAAVVRRIYSLINEGNGPHQVARILHDDKIEKPSYYLAKNNIVKKPSALETPYPYSWQAFTISHIVGRIEYLGHLANFKHEKPSFKSKKFVTRPREEWLIFENSHEAIVTQEVWDMAQKMRETKRRIDTLGEANPLTGLLFCADCGAKLYNNRGRNHSDSYTCKEYKMTMAGFEEPRCSQHYVSTEAVRGILLEVIKRTTSFVREYEDEFVKMVMESSSLKQDETLKSHTRRIAKNEKRIAELDKMFLSLYADKVKGIISEERFVQMSEICEREQLDLKEQNAALKTEVETWTDDKNRADSFVALVRKYTRIEELTTPVLYEFIDKVVVHEAVWSEATETEKRKGTRKQQIDVHLKYIGHFGAPDIRSAEEIAAEEKEEDRLARIRGYKRKYNRKKAAEKKAAEEVTATPKPAA
jgi:DNA invertase Pin-like site-specific DNA recombinase